MNYHVRYYPILTSRITDPYQPAAVSPQMFRLVLFLLAALTYVSAPAARATDAETRLIDQLLADRKPWKGDFDGMLKRGYIRVLTVHDPMIYFLDDGRQRGTTYELFKLFEKEINEKHLQKNKLLKTHIIFIVVPRDKLIQQLADGYGDIAAANLTITPRRRELVDFSDPFVGDVEELLITGPKAPKINRLQDLSGKEIYVRKSSSYYSSILKLNEQFKAQGIAPVKIRPANENLEDTDIVEMVNAGLIPMMVMDSHKAQFWRGIFENIKVHNNIVLRSGARIAWALRKNSPKLKARLNAFVKDHKKGTLMGNILFKRYLKENKWVKNSTAEIERKKFESMAEIFKKYADKYQFDYLQMAAQGYQESQLDQSKRSPAGAIGVMQLLPSTAKDKNVDIPDIEKLEPNIHAGIKYMRFLRDRYFNSNDIAPLDKALFSLAAYNAGPGRIAQLRKEAGEMGLDPNVWFDNVEVVAAKRVGREPVQYVSNIYKYYIAYALMMEDREKKEKAIKQIKKTN